MKEETIMSIIEIKAKKMGVGPEMAWIAEALTEDENGKQVYVTVQYYDNEYYSVSEQSIYDYFDDDRTEPVECQEEYNHVKDAEDSQYIEVFKTLRKVLDVLE